MDVAFRGVICGADLYSYELEDEEADAVAWAVELAGVLAGGEPLEAREDFLKIEALGMTGTADLACIPARWSADLKSGQARNYMEQQAAYALGFMDAHFEDEWTAYLFYCDLRDFVRYEFTRDGAERIIREQIARRKDPQRVPTPCEYCGWCAARFRCEARLEMAMPLVPITDCAEPEAAFELILADNEKLSGFLKACKTVSDLEERARQVAKERLVEGQASGLKIPGVSLVNRKGSQVFPAGGMMPVIEKIGAEPLLAELKPFSKAKAEKLFQEAGLVLPAEKLIETAGGCHVQVR